MRAEKKDRAEADCRDEELRRKQKGGDGAVKDTREREREREERGFSSGGRNY